jgi:single-strand DNA-binding protein
MDTHILIFTGRAVKDAEVLESKNGNSYAKFSVAVNEFYRTEQKDAKGKGAKAEKTEHDVTYYDCIVFGDKMTKAIGENVKKGTLMFIEGRPEFGAFLTKNNEPKPDITVIVNNWHTVA